MRRGELLELPIQWPTKRMLEDMRNDRGHTRLRYYNAPVKVYEWYWFWRAKKRESLLQIDIYERGMLSDGFREPRYRLFLLEDGRYYTWDFPAGSWRTACADNLSRDYQEEGYFYSDRKIWMEEGDRKTIVEFCANGIEEPRKAISRWQTHGKNRKEFEEIDSEMALVPPIPKDFNDFVRNEVMPQYIFYDAGRNVRNGYCTRCRHKVKIHDPRYGKKGICPRCRNPVTYKTRKKSGNIVDWGYAGLLQKTKTGYVYRYFRVKTEYANGEYKGGGYWEEIRKTYDPEFRIRGEYEFTRYKQTDWIRWCYRDRYRYYNCENGVVLYNRNLKTILKGSRLQYSGLEYFVKHGHEHEKLWLSEFIETYRYKPGIEQLIKCRFYRVVRHILEHGRSEYINWDQKSAPKILGLGKEYYRLISGRNPTYWEYEVAWEAQEAGVRMTWTQVQFFAKSHRNFAIYIRHTTPHKMVRYIRENLNEGTSLIQEYHDYLQMAAGLRYNLDDPWILFPRDLQKRHQEMIEERREEDKRIEKMKDEEKDVMFRKNQKPYRCLEMETEQFFLRLPREVHEIRQEGNAMHHCVATYIDRVVKGETTILFLREKSNPETPFYTMEVRDGQMIQCRAKYNGDMTEEVKAFVELFKRKKLRKQERKAG